MHNILCQLISLTGAGCLANNAAGQSFKFRIIPASEISVFPRTLAEINGVNAEYGDEVCLGEPFSYSTVTGEGFFREIPAVADTVGINFALVGEKGGFSFDNSFVFFLAGMTKERLQFAKMAATCCEGFVIHTKGRNGIDYIVGTKDDPVFVEPFEATSGLLNADRRGVPYVFKAPSSAPPYIYDTTTHGINLVANP